MEFKKGGLVASQPSQSVRPSILPEFVNVAAQSGLEFTFFNDSVPNRYFLPEIMGGGAAWLDFDGDGWLDLYLANGCPLENPDPAQGQHVSRIFRNRGDGSFSDVTTFANASHNGYGQGLAVGDYDADGFPDLFYSCYGNDVLFHNQGDGTFANVTATSGTSDPDWSSSSAWFDANSDGLLDLYVVNYMDVTLATSRVTYYANNNPGYSGPDAYNGVGDRLYLNQGDGTFVDELESLGMVAEEGKGLALSILDLDDDLRPEIYVANDMAPNFLFTRSEWFRTRSPRGTSAKEKVTSPPSIPEGSPTTKPLDRQRYSEVAMAAGCAVSNMGLNEASMGISCADFDGDGLIDIYLTHFLNSKNTLYHNQGQLSFVDDSFKTRVAATSYNSLGFGTVPLDYDRDGAPDLLIANGHVQGPKVRPYEMHPQLLWNNGSGQFRDITEFAGEYFADLWVGRSAVAADYDRDGDVDVAVTHLHRPMALLRNDTKTGRHYVGLDLRTPSRIPPVGGRIRITTQAGTRTLAIQAGGSYLGSADSRLVFSTGATLEPPKVEIFWPSGRVQVLDRLTPDQYWIVYEGDEPLPDPVGPGAGA